MAAVTGYDLASEGIRKSYANAKAEWKVAADFAVLETALRMPTFTTDDVCERMPLDYETSSAMGAVLIRARKAGWIQSTGTFKAAERRALHAKMRPIWRSLIYDKGQP